MNSIIEGEVINFRDFLFLFESGKLSLTNIK